MFSSILAFIIVLSVIVLVHEAGHFFVAKKMGVKVEEFGFGIPPKIFGKKIGETVYSINLLPFGGFVKLHGESSEEEITDSNRAFLTKSKKARILILSAGVIMNFLLAVIAFSIVYSFSGIPRETDKVKVLEVTTGSPAQVAGVIPGDVVKEVEKENVTSVNQFVALIDESKGEKIRITLERQIEEGVEDKNITLTPRENPPENEGPLGVVITSTEIYYAPFWQRPFVGIYYGFKEAVFWGKALVAGFVGIFANLFKGVTPKDIAGPVGIFAITSQAATIGVLAVINFIGILSVNLAILNIIPFPALDGGRILFVLVEIVTRKKVTPKIESIVHTIGFVILILLLLAITAHDIQGLISAGGLKGFGEKLFK